jgi:thioredoxin reductase (NADPH)
MSQTDVADVLIIGGGPAAYTAAAYTGRAGLRTLVVEGYASGGQIARSGHIDNFPSYPEGIAGAELGDRMREQATRFGARLITDEVTAVNLDGQPFAAETLEGTSYRATSMIIATGAKPRRLGLPVEEEYEGRGICFCAICDGPFFTGRRVAVVGGGDAALEEAVMLSKLASSVVLVHRREQFRANASLRAAIPAIRNITLRTPYIVSDILGDDETGVTGVRLRGVDDGDEIVEQVDGLFVAVGNEPASEMFTRWLATDAHGFLLTEPGTTATSVPGVFVAGDVSDPRYRQAVTAAAAGCRAALDLERWFTLRTAAVPTN